MAEIMTAYEVATLLRIHVRTIYNLAEQGALPGNKIGRSWRFKKREILRLVSKKDRALGPTEPAVKKLEP